MITLASVPVVWLRSLPPSSSVCWSSGLSDTSSVNAAPMINPGKAAAEFKTLCTTRPLAENKTALGSAAEGVEKGTSRSPQSRPDAFHGRVLGVVRSAETIKTSTGGGRRQNGNRAAPGMTHRSGIDIKIAIVNGVPSRWRCRG